MDITSFPVAQIGTRTLAPPRELRWGRSTETPAGKLEEVMMISRGNRDDFVSEATERGK
jgi:hypothetical protein